MKNSFHYEGPFPVEGHKSRAENILEKWGGSSHQQRRVRVYVRAHAIARSWTAGKEVGVLCPLARRSGGAGAPPAPPESPPLQMVKHPQPIYSLPCQRSRAHTYPSNSIAYIITKAHLHKRHRFFVALAKCFSAGVCKGLYL